VSITNTLATQTFDWLKEINMCIIDSEILKIDWNHVQNDSDLILENDISILLIDSLDIVPVFENGHNFFHSHWSNTVTL